VILILNNYLDKIGKKKCLLQSAALSFSADILLVIYMAKVMIPKILSKDLVLTALKLQGLNPETLNPMYLQELISVMQISSYTMLAIFLLYNCVIYFFLTRSKKWALTYIKGYAFSAAILSVFEFIAPLFSNYRPGFITAITFIMYLITFYMLRRLKQSEEK